VRDQRDHGRAGEDSQHQDRRLLRQREREPGVPRDGVLHAADANTWAAEDFKIVDNADGTPNPAGAQAPPGSSATMMMNVGLLGAAALLLPAAAAFRRRRQSA
jgi:hypothetical protein